MQGEAPDRHTHTQARAKSSSRHSVPRSLGIIARPRLPIPTPQPLTRAPCSGGSFCSRQSGVPSSGSIPEKHRYPSRDKRALTLGLTHVTFRRAGKAGRLKVLLRVRRTSALFWW